MGIITPRLQALECRRLMATGELDPTFGNGGVDGEFGDL
jgi:hypothetical protein